MKEDLTNVILIDDDKGVRDTIRFMLNEMAIYKIVECTNGQEALNYFDAEPEANISLIICDWNMPQKTGIEFLREIRQVYPELPFLMVTARGDEASVMAAKSGHINGYILKPFSFKDLKKKIDVALGRKAD
jgi:two-component system, chemotaxis family, chemotaxis protein CheY